MANELSRPMRQRILGIVIASLFGGIFGAVLAWRFYPDVLIVDRLHAEKILVSGDQGVVSITGDSGISLHRHDYASALLWFNEPGTGNPGTGGPALVISGPEDQEHQEFRITPSGQKDAPPPVIE